MKSKKRRGKNEDKILAILKQYDYVEISVRLLASKIKGIDAPESKYNSIRNTINRLEKSKLVQTITIPVFGGNILYFPRGISTRVRMVRLWADDRSWDCKDGVYFSGDHMLESRFSNCKV